MRKVTLPCLSEAEPEGAERSDPEVQDVSVSFGHIVSRARVRFVGAALIGLAGQACRREAAPSPAPDASFARALAACPTSAHPDQGTQEREAREHVTIDAPCEDGGDPDEEVDVTRDEGLGRMYTPRRALPLDQYTAVVEAKPSDLGFTRIRARLVFSAGDLRNVLGRLPSCVPIRAAGPMKNGTGSQGLGYAIRLVDPRGRVCQGFVSATAVTVR
jgi:hypothetical protein